MLTNNEKRYIFTKNMTKTEITTVHFSKFDQVHVSFFPHSISRETGEKVDELRTHLKIFEFFEN